MTRHDKTRQNKKPKTDVPAPAGDALRASPVEGSHRPAVMVRVRFRFRFGLGYGLGLKLGLGLGLGLKLGLGLRFGLGVRGKT
jgi:hypothetical protein